MKMKQTTAQSHDMNLPIMKFTFAVVHISLSILYLYTLWWNIFAFFSDKYFINDYGVTDYKLIVL